MRLTSGNLLFVNHSTTSSRSSLYAYLSEDGGDTWISMPLDTRSDVSYPCAFESDGKVYITWDKGRYLEKEIRLTVLDEDDIRAGRIVSEGSADKLVVSKLNDEYTDIVELVTQFEREYKLPVGTPSSRIRDALPESIVVKDNQGNEFTLTGTWRSSGYDENTAGEYTITFSTTLPATLSDTYGLLCVRAELFEETPSSPGWVLPVCIAGGVVLVGAVVAAVLLVKRKKHAK